MNKHKPFFDESACLRYTMIGCRFKVEYLKLRVQSPLLTLQSSIFNLQPSTLTVQTYPLNLTRRLPNG